MIEKASAEQEKKKDWIGRVINNEMNCIICGESSFSNLYNNTLKRCNHCGFTTACVDIGPEELKQVYSEKYFNGEEYLDYLRDKTPLQFNFQKRLEQIKKVGAGAYRKKVLEIGCAYGFFADIFKKMYPGASYIGLDVVAEAIEYGKKTFGQNLIDADYLSYAFSDKFTDVFMWDVIEHLERPDLFLRKVFSELEDDGFVYITTGDIDAFLPRIQKKNWRMIHPPTHLHYFSRKTLVRLLESIGFEISFVKYPTVYRSLKQIFYSLFVLKRNRLGFRNMYTIIPEEWMMPLNTFDIMFVGARKRGANGRT